MLGSSRNKSGFDAGKMIGSRETRKNSTEIGRLGKGYGLRAKEEEEHHARRLQIRIGEGTIRRKCNGDETRL